MREFEIDKVEDRASEFFEGVNPAHDWFHVKRVENLAMKLAGKEDADQEVVKVSVLLHDIGRKKEDEGVIEDHSSWGAEKSKEILTELDFEPDFVEKVSHCIDSHRYSKDPEPSTLEAKVLSDADNLDAIGATGIARTFTYGGEHKSIIADPGLPAEEDSSKSGQTSLNHLVKKILNLRDRIYTDTGLEIARERHEYVEGFVERFRDEIKDRK